MTADDTQTAGAGDECPDQLDSLSAKQLKTALTSGDDPTERSTDFDADQGRYRIKEVLGKGGMGMVLRASDRFFNRDVAVKILHTKRQARGRDLLRFVEEAQVTGQLEHPNIIPVHELERAVDGSIYYTMKRVQGDTLRDVLKRIKNGDPETLQAYPLNRLLEIFTKVCDAIAYAHSKGVINRDIKPANIMLGAYGEVLVLDWGLSRILDLPDLDESEENVTSAAREVADLTQHGSVFGTPGYAAPEQIRSANTAGQLSDLFSLGAVLFSIITLEPPIRGDSVQQRLVRTIQGKIDKPEERLPEAGLPHLTSGVPSALSAVAMRALAYEPSERYGSVAELRDEVQAYLSGFATTAEKAGPIRRLQLFCRRYPWESGISACAALLLAAATVGTLTHLRRSRAEAASVLRETENLHAQAETSRKAKEEHLREIQKSAGHFAEQSKITLESYSARRMSYQSDDGKIFMWSPIIATREAESAIKLDQDSSSYWYQKGLTLEAPDLKAPSKPGGKEEVWSKCTVHWKLDEAETAFDKAIELSTDGSDVDKAARRELAKVKELQSLKNADGTIHPAALPRLLDWLALTGRSREADILRIPIAKMSIAKLSERRAELGAAGLVFHKPGSWASASMSVFVRSTRYKKPDFTVLKGTIIDEIEISYPGDVDLKPLRETGLSCLSLRKTKIRDLSPLKGMALESFLLQSETTTDVSCLDGMPLRKLQLYNTPIAKLPDLGNASLIELRISGTNITDLSPLKGMPLRRFHAHGVPLDNLDALAGMPLDVVHFCGANVKSLQSLAGAAPCVIKGTGSKLESLEGPRTDRLTEVRLSDTSIRDLSPLRGSKVRLLWLTNCPIESIKPLEGIPLRDLRLGGTKIKSIEGLEGMDLRRLDISNCAVSNLGPLFGSRIRFLDIDGTGVTDMGQLVRLPKLLCLRIDSSQVPAFRKVLPNMDELYRFAIDEGPWIIRRDFVQWLSKKSEAKPK